MVSTAGRSTSNGGGGGGGGGGCGGCGAYGYDPGR